MTPDIVNRYAYLQVLAERCSATGKQVPATVTLELKQLESMAQVRMSPAQIQSALHHVEVQKMHLRQHIAETERVQFQQGVQRKVDGLTQELTRSMLGKSEGLTRKQVADVAAGKKVTFEGVKRLTQEQRDGASIARTKNMDPKGVGWKEAEFVRRMDALAEATPDQFRELSKGYRTDPQELRRASTRWLNDRYEYGVARRREARDEERGLHKSYEREPNNDEKRRAAVVESFARVSADDIDRESARGRRDTSSFIDEEIPDALLNEKEPDGKLSRRAQIARAMEQHEGDSI